ncbi:MAG: oligosaccharide flippase family protein [Chloroflexi bacterium]|nr:oligosaccharide flippase family protein [Chloroflexota bacterium]
MSLLLQATATVGLASGLSILLKMVGAKLVASTLGPSGVGVYAQLVLIADFGAIVSFLGLGTGIIRYASEFRSGENWGRLRGLESTLVFTIVPFSLLIGASIVVLSDELSSILLDEPGYGLAITLVGVSLPFYAAAGIAESLINGAKQVRSRAITLAASAAASLAFLLPLVLFLGVLGAAISLAAAAAFRAATAWFYAVRLETNRPAGRRWSTTLYDVNMLGRVLQYGITSLTSTPIMYFSVLLVRTSIITQLGSSANGLYQVVWASQASWLPLVLSGSYSYFYPSYCEAKDSQSRCDQMNSMIRSIVLVSTPFLAVYMLFRPEVVLALYTPQFLPAVPLLGISLLYGLFSLLTHLLIVPLLASGRFWVIVALNSLQQAVFVAGSHFLLPIFQLYGVVYSAGIASVLVTVSSLLYARQFLNLRLSAANIKTLSLSMALILAVFGLSELPRPMGLAASFALLVVWADQVLDRSELANLRDLASSRAKWIPFLGRNAAGHDYLGPRKYPSASPRDQPSNPR